MIARFRSPLVFAAAALTACAAGGNSPTGSGASAGSGGASSASASSASASSSGELGGFHPDGGGGGSGCAAGADFLYVVGFGAQGSMLYSFYPPTLAFSKIGPLQGCPPGIFSQGGPYPISMAIDRNAIAWINYYDGGQQIVTDRLFKVDLDTVTCTDTGKDLTHPAGPFIAAGLAFLPDPNDPQKDILHVGAQYGMGQGTVSELGTIDLATLTASPVAPTDATYKITGTADGRLYGFGASQIVEFDPATAAPKSEKFVSLPFQSYPGNAFAFWGGDLWIFEASSSNPDTASTTAFLVDLTTGTATAKATVDLYVTGAGISTCAPLEPPK